MSIVREECDQRQTNVERMIGEFRDAQSRRLAKATVVKGADQVVESPRDADVPAAVATSTNTSASRPND